MAASHPTTELPFIYYSANVSTVKVSGASYAKIAEQVDDADDQRRKEREEKKRVERERREERARQEERARREKERGLQKEREEEKQRRKEERKQKERDDPRGKDDDHDSDLRNRYVNEWRRDRDHRRDDEYDRVVVAVVIPLPFTVTAPVTKLFDQTQRRTTIDGGKQV